MKALLIWPKFDSFSFWNFERVCEVVGVKYMTPPLGLLTVAALLPSDWELRLIDENVSSLEDSDIEWADIVMVGSKIVHRGRALKVIERAQRLKRLVAVGGPDPSMSPEYYRKAGVDFLCQGEGEVTVPLLLADLAQGRRSGKYVANRIPDLTESPVPRFDLIDHRDYLYVGLQFSRGCPHRCEFCNVIDLFQNKYRTKTTEQVLCELEALYRTGYRGQVDFFDAYRVGSLKKTKALLTAIASWLEARGYPFQLSTSVTINIANDAELLELFRRARFKYFLVGIETPDEHALKAASKPQNTGFSLAEAADTIYRKAGATIHSGFLLGLDGEPPDIGDQIIRCIDEACIPWVMAGIVYPLPGTQLARRLEREGRLFASARNGIDAGARDQISAGLQFKPQRSASAVIADLVRVMRHAFTPAHYLSRCANVASRLSTVPKLVPSWRLFWRNLATVFRLSLIMTRTPDTRVPYWRGLLKVLFRNPAGVEAYVTLSVLYLHFHAMLPYCYEQLALQQQAVLELGEEAWLEKRLGGDSATPGRPSRKLSVLRSA